VTSYCGAALSCEARRQACHVDLSVEQAARLVIPASPWSKPPGLPCRRSRRQSNTHATRTGFPNAIRRQDWCRGPHDCALHLSPPPQSGARRSCGARCICGAGFLACGRLSSRPGPPSPTALYIAQPHLCRGGPACPPPLFHLRVLRGLFFSVSSVPSVVCLLRVLRGLFFSVSSVPSVVCLLRVLCGLFFLCPPCRVRCGAGFLACGRLSSRPGGPLPIPSAQPNAAPCRGGPACPPLRRARSLACHTGNSCGASRQACHAGGHAGRATQSRDVRESTRHPARTTARSTSGRRRKVEHAWLSQPASFFSAAEILA